MMNANLTKLVSESSDGSDSVSSESDVDDDEESAVVRVLGWEPKGSQRPLGEWEKHTTVR